MGLVHFEGDNVLYYPYTPSQGAGYAYMVFFVIAAIAHLILMCWHKTWLLIPLTLGGICEIFGHYGRAWGGREPFSPSPFMLQLMLILVAPVFIAATVYVTLARLKQRVLDKPPRRCGVSALFIVAFCSQIGGGLVQILGDLHLMDIGDDVVLGGLSFQLAALALYLYLVVRFRSRTLGRTGTSQGWGPYVWALIASTLLIWVRNLVRVIEFAQGWDGFVMQHEAMLYVFDSSLMLIVLVLFAVWHPGRFMRSTSTAEKLAGIRSDDEVEIGGSERRDLLQPRPWI